MEIQTQAWLSSQHTLCLHLSLLLQQPGSPKFGSTSLRNEKIGLFWHKKNCLQSMQSFSITCIFHDPFKDPLYIPE